MSDGPKSRDAETRTGLSRRSFLRTGAAGALGSGLLPAHLGAENESTEAESGPQPLGPAPVEISLLVNGESHTLKVEPRTTLLDALRDQLEITGPKKVCDRGTCGACTVREDGQLIYACSRLAVEADGRQLVTVEGLGSPDAMHPLQRAFVQHDAQQCGFCTPGFVLAIDALLERSAQPSDREIAEALGGNLCRCGTYGGMRNLLEEVRRG